jgi:hypothetical protein
MEFGMDQIYLLCFAVGLLFAIVSGVVSGVFGHHAGHGADVEHQIDAGDVGDTGTIHFSPLSPVTICMFITAFGGVGLIAKRLLGLGTLEHVGLASVSGFVVAAMTVYLFNALFDVTQGSSEPRHAEVLGLEAEVTVSIPDRGIGQIAYVLRGSRFTAPARGVDGEPFAAHAAVVVRRIVGGTYLVASARDAAGATA